MNAYQLIALACFFQTLFNIATFIQLRNLSKRIK